MRPIRLLTICLFSMGAFHCTNSGNGDGTNGLALLIAGVAATDGSNHVWTTGEQSSTTINGKAFKTVYVGKLTFFTGVSDSATASTDHPFWIGSTEVTYALWNYVRTWSLSNGYSYEHTGVMGDGTGDTEDHPVTTIDWRDAMVWCNAFTEYYNQLTGENLSLVYFKDSGFTNPHKSSVRTGDCPSAYSATPAGNCSNPYIDPDATGFRLPPWKYWELAARYIGDNNGDGDILDAGEYYPGDYGSGASADTGDVTATNVVCWNSDNSGGSTHVVADRQANGLGLYDMCGNVLEWNEEQPSSPSYSDARYVRGGSYGNSAAILQIGGLNTGANGNGSSSYVGFRLARLLTN